MFSKNKDLVTKHTSDVSSSCTTNCALADFLLLTFCYTWLWLFDRVLLNNENLVLILCSHICILFHVISQSWLLQTTKNIQKRNDKGQKESNGFMPTEVHIWHLPVCKVSFLVTLKHHPGWGLSLTWQFAAVFTWLPWMQQDWQTLVCPQLLSVVPKESTLRPSCCVWMPIRALMSQLWHKKSRDLLPHLDQQVHFEFRTLQYI